MENFEKENAAKKEKGGLGKISFVIGLIFSILAIFLCVTNMIIWVIIFFFLWSIPVGLFASSITCGMVALVKKGKSKKEKTYALVGVLLPLLTIFALGMLYSGGVLVIRFM